MTPNQIDGIAETVRQLLHDGHRQGLTPTAGPVYVTEHAYGNGAYIIYTEWIEPEESEVTLSAIVGADGNSTAQPAEWAHANTESHTAVPPAVLTDCVVCGGLGCEHCPKVVGLA